MMMLDRFNRPKVDLVDLFPLVTWQFFLFFFMFSFLLGCLFPIGVFF